MKAKRFSGEHWQYDESVSYTKKNNDALDEYHKKLPIFYFENGNSMQDDELDELIYGYPVSQTAWYGVVFADIMATNWQQK